MVVFSVIFLNFNVKASWPLHEGGPLVPLGRAFLNLKVPYHAQFTVPGFSILNLCLYPASELELRKIHPLLLLLAQFFRKVHTVLEIGIL